MPSNPLLSLKQISLFSDKVQQSQVKSPGLTYNLAQVCGRCSQTIIHNQCITICSCYRYAHKKCLVAELNARNPNKQELNLYCGQCKKRIVTYQEIQFVFKWNFNLKSLIGFIISLILTVIAVWLIFKFASHLKKIEFSIQNLMILFGTVLMSVGIVFMGLFALNMFLVRQFTITSVQSTNLDLMISAFAGLDFDNQGENTGMELIK